MCGIAGYVDFDDRPSEDALRRMARALHRRGPDDEGILVDGPCGFAHRRLSIIDPDGSPQPMEVPGSDVALTFNGEIYNYPALRRELSGRGTTLRWRGDTEVLLRWVDAEWERALPRFDGMFAFGAWNRRTAKLLLARDALGEKPLFYINPRPGLLAFASEVKALFEHPAITAGLDRDALRQVVRFRAVYGDRSLYTGVRQLEPGCWLEFGRSGLRSGRFYDLAAEAENARAAMRGWTDAQLRERFGRLVEESVRERLIADVPVGAFLSGGLDSSVIVSVIRGCRQPGEELRTFSVGFRDDPNSELPYARAVADAIGTTHTEVNLAEEDYARQLSEMSACRDAPLSEPADPAIARMSEVARESVKVVLSGEGADEAFCGYPKYGLARAGGAVRSVLRVAGPERAAAIARVARVDPRRALVAARALSRPSEVDRLAQWFSYLDHDAVAALLPGLEWTDRQWEATTESQAAALAQPWGGPLERMQGVDCKTWLPGNLLERGDRMTMAAGLEMRVPFLDKELVPFGIALPAHMKVRGRVLKRILRDWAADRLPPEILRRPKWGFRVPLDRWFRGHLRETLFGYLTAEQGLCGTFGDRRAIEELLVAHDTGQTDASMELWTLLAAEVWYQDVFRPAAAATARAA